MRSDLSLFSHVACVFWVLLQAVFTPSYKNILEYSFPKAYIFGSYLNGLFPMKCIFVTDRRYRSKFFNEQYILAECLKGQSSLCWFEMSLSLLGLWISNWFLLYITIPEQLFEKIRSKTKAHLKQSYPTSLCWWVVWQYCCKRCYWPIWATGPYTENCFFCCNHFTWFFLG